MSDFKNALPTADRSSTLSSLRGKHGNEHVYILGTGPQLHDLESWEIQRMKEGVTIGLNQAWLFDWPDYLISSHPESFPEPNNKTIFLHTRFAGEKTPLAKGALPILRSRFTRDSQFSREDSVLLSDRNVVFLAIHLAYIMGARFVSFVGVEMNDDLHFCDQPPQRSFSEFSHEETLRMYRERMKGMALFATKKNSLPYRAGCPLNSWFSNA